MGRGAHGHKASEGRHSRVYALASHGQRSPLKNEERRPYKQWGENGHWLYCRVRVSSFLAGLIARPRARETPRDECNHGARACDSNQEAIIFTRSKMNTLLGAAGLLPFYRICAPFDASVNIKAPRRLAMARFK